MNDAHAKARALEAKAADRREANRRKFPTAAKLMEQFKAFNPMVVEARDGENYVVNDKVVRRTETKVIPYTWTEEIVRIDQGGSQL